MTNKYIILIALIISTHFSFAGCPVINVPLENRIENSELVIEAEVIKKTSYENQAQNFIYTAHTLKVYKLFKGNLRTETITLITEGGFVGLKGLIATPNLNTEIGQTGIFFLSKNNKWENPDNISESYFSPIGPLGFIFYDFNNTNAFDMLNNLGNIKTQLYPKIIDLTNNYEIIQDKTPKTTRSTRRATPTITSFAPDSINAGTQEILTIEGTDFGVNEGSVLFPNANAGGGGSYVLALEIISWSDTKIELKVPSDAGTGKFYIIDENSTQSPLSANELIIPWAHLNVNYNGDLYEIRQQDLNSNGGITWTWDTDFDANDDAKASFLRALENWRCHTGINWEVSGVKTNPSHVDDGDNMVYYDDNLSVGVLGVCYSHYKGWSCGGDLEWYVSELDIVFIKTFDWEYGPNLPAATDYDFESVALHELGHGHQLGHIIDGSNVMNWAISNGSVRRELQENNLDCGKYVLAKSLTGICGQTDPMILIKEKDCLVRDPLIFRSKKSGKWNEIATWEVSDWSGASWTDANFLPSIYNDSVVVRNNHTVEVTHNMVLTRTCIQNGGIINWTDGEIYLGERHNKNLNIEDGGLFIHDNESVMESDINGIMFLHDEAKISTSNSKGIDALKGITFDNSPKQSFTFNKNGAQKTGTSLPSSFSNLIIDKGSELNLELNIKVRDKIELIDGTINTDSYELTLGESTANKGILDFTSGQIEGTFTRWFDGTNSGLSSGFFPLAHNGNDKFITIEYTTAPTTGGTLTAKYVNSAMGDDGLPINVSATGTCASYDIKGTSESYWEINDDNGLDGGIYDISFEAEGFSYITDLCELNLVKRSGMGSWGLVGTPVQTSGTLAKPIVKAISATGWSNFGFGTGEPNPLPISLSDFKVSKLLNQNAVMIEWTTVSEVNNDFFEVQKSNDLNNWETVSKVKGNGNSFNQNYYKTFDYSPFNGVNYYRLRQFDFDGNSSVSPIKEVIFQKRNQLNRFIAYPSPAQSELNISSNAENIKNIKITTIEGKEIMNKNFENRHTNTVQTIDISSLASGLYYIEILSEDYSEIHKFVKQ